MGRTPGKWIKTLLRKRSSKSNVLKEKDVLNSANRGEELISSKCTPTEKAVAANPSLSSLPITGKNAVNEIDKVNTVAVEVPDSADDVSSRNGRDVQTAVCIGLPEESEQVRMQEAAIKAQAAFRGYLARRAFRTLKGIVRLQAVIRGHLVRRQAVATLFCLQGIVKFQLLIRRRKGSIPSIPANKRSQKLWRNAFIRQLLAASPSALALHLQYSPDDPNCEWEWLRRWTRLRFWEPISRQKKSSDSKSQAKHGISETDKGLPKRSVRKLPTLSPEIGSPRSSFQSDKVKRNTGKISSSMAGSVEVRSQVEAEKSKLNGRKTRVIANGVSDLVEAENKALRQSAGKVPGVTASDSLLEGISDLAEVNGIGSDDATPNGAPRPADVLAAVDELHEKSLPQLNISEGNCSSEKKGLKPNDGSVSIEDNKKSSQRRASLPAKIEQPEFVSLSTTKVPSYMAPTQSAKAKLRGQGSPKFVQDDTVTNGVVRRHSLLSSTNSKVASYSPRVHRTVEASGNGANKGDKSQTSSRDVGEKGIKAEWKR